jgi:hypothetical protein
MAVAFALVHVGYVVAKPYGENCRYDLVIDKNGVLSRVQVKTGRLRNGVIEWHCCSTHSQGARLFTKPYTDQIDFFGVYCPQLRTTYLIPIEETSRRGCSLRIHPTKNRQTRRIRWAQDYLIGTEPDMHLVVGAELMDGVTESGSSPS